MFVDASALVAILLDEPEGADLDRRYLAADQALTSGLAVYEAALAIARRREGDVEQAVVIVNRLLILARTRVVSIGADEARVAIEAFARFGKGRHPAKLNMGDCFAYACARTHGVPLLYKGDDFALTDIAAA